MTPDKLLGEFTPFQDKNYRNFYLVDFDKKQKLLNSWLLVAKEGQFGTYEIRKYAVPTSMLTKQELKKLDLEEYYVKPSEIKDETVKSCPDAPKSKPQAPESIKNNKNNTKPTPVKEKPVQPINNKPKGAKRGRAPKNYDGIPTSLTCSKCGKVTEYHPSMIIVISKKKNVTIEQLQIQHLCKKCFPRTGRKPKNKK